MNIFALLATETGLNVEIISDNAKTHFDDFPRRQTGHQASSEKITYIPTTKPMSRWDSCARKETSIGALMTPRLPMRDESDSESNSSCITENANQDDDDSGFHRRATPVILHKARSWPSHVSTCELKGPHISAKCFSLSAIPQKHFAFRRKKNLSLYLPYDVFTAGRSLLSHAQPRQHAADILQQALDDIDTV